MTVSCEVTERLRREQTEFGPKLLDEIKGAANTLRRMVPAGVDQGSLNSPKLIYLADSLLRLVDAIQLFRKGALVEGTAALSLAKMSFDISGWPHHEQALPVEREFEPKFERMETEFVKARRDIGALIAETILDPQCSFPSNRFGIVCCSVSQGLAVCRKDGIADLFLVDAALSETPPNPIPLHRAD